MRLCFFFALLALYLFRNPIAKLAVNQFAPSISGVDLKVAKVQIGWSSIEVTGVHVDEPAEPNSPQVEVANVKIAFTLLDGVQDGIWARRVDVLEPTLHVRFDAAGNLISKFPESNNDSGNNSIPISELLVRDASLVIHQIGRQPFTIDNMELIGQFGKSVRVRANVPKIFGGNAVLDADLNASTFAGQSRFAIENVAIDSQQLNELPLLKDSIRQLGLSAHLSATGQIEHPVDPLNLKGYRANLAAVLKNVYSTKHGLLLDQIECTATSSEGIVHATLGGNPLSGRIDAELHSDLNQKPTSATAWLRAQSCDLRAIAAELVPEAKLNAKTSVAAKAILTLENEAVSFNGGLNSTTNSISIDGVPVENVFVKASTNGMTRINDLASLTGTVSGTVESQGVSLADVATRFQLPSATGRVCADANFAMPLQQIMQPEFYSIQANIAVKGATFDEFTLNDSTATLTVENANAEVGLNQAIVSDSRSNEVLRLSAGGKANLSANGKVVAGFELVSTLNQKLVALLGLSALKPQGNFRLTGSANNQIDRASKIETWTANTTLQGIGLSILDESVSDLKADCLLENGSIVVPPFDISWRNNKFVFGGNGNINGGLAVQSTLFSNSIQIADVADVVSRISNQPLLASGTAGFGGVIQVNVPDWNFSSVDIRGGGNAKVSRGRFQGAEVGDLVLEWDANPNELKISSGSQDFFGGSYAVDAILQNADWTTAVLQGNFKDVQAARLAGLSKFQLPVSGVIDGRFELREIESLNSCKGGAWINSRGLTIQRLPVEISKGQLTFNSGIADITSEGTVSRGRFEAKARTGLSELLEFANSTNPAMEKIPLIVDAKLTDFPVTSSKKSSRCPQSYVHCKAMCQHSSIVAFQCWTVTKFAMSFASSKTCDSIKSGLQIKSSAK